MKINHKLDKNINCLWPAHTPTSQHRNIFNQYFKNKIKKTSASKTKRSGLLQLDFVTCSHNHGKNKASYLER